MVAALDLLVRVQRVDRAAHVGKVRKSIFAASGLGHQRTANGGSLANGRQTVRTIPDTSRWPEANAERSITKPERASF